MTFAHEYYIRNSGASTLQHWGRKYSLITCKGCLQDIHGLKTQIPVETMMDRELEPMPGNEPMSPLGSITTTFQQSQGKSTSSFIWTIVTASKMSHCLLSTLTLILFPVCCKVIFTCKLITVVIYSFRPTRLYVILQHTFYKHNQIAPHLNRL